MKKVYYEIETLVIKGVHLDVKFRYEDGEWFEIDNIFDTEGMQDLTPILSEWVIDKIYQELVKKGYNG